MPSEEGRLPLPAIHRDLAQHMSASYVVNARQLRVLTIAFRLGAIFLVDDLLVDLRVRTEVQYTEPT